MIIHDETHNETNDFLKKSALYREFFLEREEILKHKWIESEKRGRDIGFEDALFDWIMNHKAEWKRHRPLTAATASHAAAAAATSIAVNKPHDPSAN